MPATRQPLAFRRSAQTAWQMQSAPAYATSQGTQILYKKVRVTVAGVTSSNPEGETWTSLPSINGTWTFGNNKAPWAGYPLYFGHVLERIGTATRDLGEEGTVDYGVYFSFESVGLLARDPVAPAPSAQALGMYIGVRIETLRFDPADHPLENEGQFFFFTEALINARTKLGAELPIVDGGHPNFFTYLGSGGTLKIELLQA